jgi:hypothetical protein
MNVEQFYFLCKVKQIILSFFIVITCVLSTPAKCQGFQPFADSIIYYQLVSVEHDSKLPFRKEAFAYTLDQKVKEKRTFRWDRKNNQWILEYKYRFIFRDQEMLIEKVAVENQKNEILIARNIAFLDTNGSIVKMEMFKVDRYSGKSVRQNAQEFEYKGDTLISYKLFEQGTTFFKKKEVNYLYQKHKWSQLEKTFEEVQSNIEEKKYDYSILDGLPTKMVLRSNKGEVIRKDSFEHRKKLLSSWYTEIIEHNEKSKLSQHSMKYYRYDEFDQIKTISTIRLNPQKKAINHSGNTITYYYSTKRIFFKPDIFLNVDPTDF